MDYRLRVFAAKLGGIGCLSLSVIEGLRDAGCGAVLLIILSAAFFTLEKVWDRASRLDSKGE